MEPLTGTLEERYRVLERVGAGAFGEVYRAHDLRLNRTVALKRLRLEALTESHEVERAKQRFLQEARIAAKLKHPNIVTIHDILATPHHLVMVMELIEGRTLQHVLEERGRLDYFQTGEILRSTAQALDYAHSEGIIHRDIKPANIMIDAAGVVKVTDFGIAKVDSTATLTGTGHLIGTPNYMSPEQARGEVVDARADIFSLGCLLYECLSGRRAFDGDSVTAVLLKVVGEAPPRLDMRAAGLPLEVEQVLAKALNKAPHERYKTAGELVSSLERAAQHTLAAKRPDLPPLPLRQPQQPASQDPHAAPIETAPHSVAPVQAAAAMLAQQAAQAQGAHAPPPPVTPEHVTPELTAETARDGEQAVAAQPPLAETPAKTMTGRPEGLGLRQLLIPAMVALPIVLLAAWWLMRPNDVTPIEKVTDPTLVNPDTMAASASATRDDDSLGVDAWDADTEAEAADETPLGSAELDPSLERLEPPADSIAATSARPTREELLARAQEPNTAPQRQPEEVTARGSPPQGSVAPQTTPPPASSPTTVPAPSPTLAKTEPVPEPTPSAPGVAVAMALPPGASYVDEFTCNRNADFDVDPEEAMVTINGVQIGIADDWDGAGGGKLWEFDKPGTYTVELTLEGWHTAWVKITVDPEARRKTADVDTELKKVRRKRRRRGGP